MELPDPDWYPLALSLWPLLVVLVMSVPCLFFKLVNSQEKERKFRHTLAELPRSLSL